MRPKVRHISRKGWLPLPTRLSRDLSGFLTVANVFRYWSYASLGHLQRYMAAEEWTYLKYRPDTSNATERSLAALDMFFLGEREEGDVDDVWPCSYCNLLVDNEIS